MKPRLYRFKPELEQLECRQAPAVITVTTTADDLTPGDGTVSLREAITAINTANAALDPDIVWIDLLKWAWIRLLMAYNSN